MKSLKAESHYLSDSNSQLKVLNEAEGFKFPDFKEKLKKSGLYPLHPTGIEIFQMNIGKMCNQVCKHCHVDAGPDRKEIMTRDTMEKCLEVLHNPSITTVDLTGGAPEMNPDFNWLVEQINVLRKKIIVRCNLTIIVSNPKYYQLPDFYKNNNVEVISSLPFYTSSRTDSQRGNGVFDKSIEALKRLNAVGYGKEGSGFILNLVYNPAGAFLPGDQVGLEREFKKELKGKFSIEFNNLFTITNLPISRYLDFLIRSGNYENYMEKLVNSYNPSAAKNVMCRNTLSIGWDGYLYDCDFNQMLELKVNSTHQHIDDFNWELKEREIVTNQHCYGCTAGAGSSCGGATT
ncbi:MAG TPA: arsenosugar biosynthesis radical SAM (seleno)protein ArsS [Cytophagales bacterium]|nr:arsenosugar biosynthesis radical SAM (seleno)protein ArsS [Cytophagales bacterium]